MSPQAARVRTLYFIIGLNVILLAFTFGVAIYVSNLNGKVHAAEHSGYEGCLRGNELREAARLALVKLGLQQRATNPALGEQPCALIYPGGTP